jgi:hypothetical protein
MIIPGTRRFALLSFTSAGTQISETISRLEGIKRLSWQAGFTYGSGGTAVKNYLQTSFDDGSSWFDIGNLAFATATAKKYLNLISGSAIVAAGTPGDAALSDNTGISGLLGPLVRIKAVSTGTYGGTTNCQHWLVVE